MDISVSDGYACVTDEYYYNGRLHFVDVDPPGSAQVLSTIDTYGIPSDVIYNGRYAYVTGETATQVFSVDQFDILSETAFLWTHSLFGTGTGIGLTGGYACVSEYTYGTDEGYGALSVINVDPPEAAAYAATIEMPGTDCEDIAVWAGHAFVLTDKQGIRIFRLW
jgi:hypothetical protein